MLEDLVKTLFEYLREDYRKIILLPVHNFLVCHCHEDQVGKERACGFHKMAWGDSEHTLC